MSFSGSWAAHSRSIGVGAIIHQLVPITKNHKNLVFRDSDRIIHELGIDDLIRPLLKSLLSWWNFYKKPNDGRLWNILKTYSEWVDSGRVLRP